MKCSASGRFVAFALPVLGCFAGCAVDLDQGAAPSLEYANPQRVEIAGYSGEAMEPFESRDGRWLFFNDLNDPAVDTKLHFAERIDDLRFRYRGEIGGANTPALEGVPSLDREGRFFFVSTRSYSTSLATIHSGHFVDGRLEGVALVPGISSKVPGLVNFDAEIGADGDTLWFVDGRIENALPKTADIFVASRRGAGFERRSDSAVLLANVNSDALEYAPAISADGRALLFTRARLQPGGGFGLYIAHRDAVSEPFGPPRRLVALAGFIEAASFAAGERAIYFHAKVDGHYAIYQARRQGGADASVSPGGSRSVADGAQR